MKDVSFDMKLSRPVQCCAGGGLAAAVGFWGFFRFAYLKGDVRSLWHDLVLWVCLALWVVGCVLVVTALGWLIKTWIAGRRKALTR